MCVSVRVCVSALSVLYKLKGGMREGGSKHLQFSSSLYSNISAVIFSFILHLWLQSYQSIRLSEYSLMLCGKENREKMLLCTVL